MARALYRSVTCNVFAPGSSSTNASTIREAWTHSDVLKIQEGQEASTYTALRALSGVKVINRSTSPGKANPIAIRTSVFEIGEIGGSTTQVSSGNGPDRGCTWVLLKHKATGKRVIEVNMHEIHQAWTSHPARQPKWNEILADVAAEVNRAMAKYPGVPVVISGDMNKSGSIDFPGLGEAEIAGTPDTYGSMRYDRMFTVGQVAPKSFSAFKTMSDHKSLLVNFEIYTPEAPGAPGPAEPASGATPTVTVPPSPSGPSPIDLRRRATFRKRTQWRYLAQRINGDGSQGEIIHPDLPLQDAEITEMLTGHNSLKGKLSPEYSSLIAPDGRPLLEEWGTAIWAEDGDTLYGGILTDSDFDGPDWGLEMVGLTSYADALPYASERFWVEKDPLTIFRDIWSHIQAQPGSNVGLAVDPGPLVGALIGVELKQVEFDTQNGPVSFESGPYKLAWYQDHDLNEKLAALAADFGFDWHEKHYWLNDQIHHRLQIGVPTLGTRRTDLRFVIGENVALKPSVSRSGDDYADEVWCLGAGEGSTIKRGVARAPINRLRRVKVISDPSLRTQAGVNAAAAKDLAWRNKLDTISEVVIRDHPHADIGAVMVGDEILIQGDAGWIDIDDWYRVISRTIRPREGSLMTLSLIRTDHLPT